MPNEILTDMTNSFDWYGKMFDWYEKKLTDMKKTVDWYGKNHISQTFLTDMVLTPPDGPCLAKSKPRKFKAYKSTKAFYSQVPKILYSERFLELKMKRRQLAEINMGGLDKRFSIEFLRIIQSFQGTS